MQFKQISRIMAFVLILNIFLMNINIMPSKADTAYDFVEISEEIKDIQIVMDKVAVINNEDKAYIYKDDGVLELDGENYIFISDKYLINDENKVFDIEKEEFLSEENNQYILEIFEELNINKENIYFYNSGLVKVDKNLENLEVIYYLLENNEFILQNESITLESEYITFDATGSLYIIKEDKLLKHEDNSVVIENLEGYKAKVVNEDKVIIFRDKSYALINISESQEEVLEEEVIEDVILGEEDEIIDELIEEDEPAIISSGSDSVTYQTHIQNEGWQAWRNNGAMSGTEGKSLRLEGIRIKVDLPAGVKVAYRTHIQDVGWQGWKYDGEMSGTSGQSKRLEGIEIKLLNAPEGYHIEYRVHVQDVGWQSWRRDGAMAGTSGQSKRLEGIQIKIVKDGATPTVSYSTHVQNQGWQSTKTNGQMSGTEGKSLRLEGIKIQLSNLEESNSIMYRTHVQNVGWQSWVFDGKTAGTEGRSLRLEAIEIKLKNDIPGYKLYYRVHVQDYGWQEWKASGETAGTVGSAKRLEGIEIKLVKDKNKSVVVDAGHNFGGDDGAYATHSGVKYIERDLNMSVASKLKRELEVKGFEVIMTRNPEDRETLALRASLEKRVNIANNLNADFFISIHQNSASAASANGVEVYYSTATPLSGGRLLTNGVEFNALDSRSYIASEKVSKSKTLSSNIVNSIANNMSRTNRGAKDNSFYVIKNTHMPAVLVECGFISNSSEAKKLADSNLQQTMAELIAIEINKQF